MIDKNLTVETALEEIGEEVISSKGVITADSLFAKGLRETTVQIEGLFSKGILEKTISMGGLFAGYSIAREKFTDLYEYLKERDRIELLLNSLAEQQNTELRKVTSWIYAHRRKQEYKDTLERLGRNAWHFWNTMAEGVMNAVEHGTNFCERGNVEVQTKIGKNGILAIISQCTPGLTKEQIEELLAKKPGSEGNRGSGFARFAAPENGRIGFEYYSEASPIFKTIILETREEIKKVRG